MSPASWSDFMKSFSDKGKWEKSLPHVSVKQDFLRCPPPKAKGHGVDRSTFPQSMNKDIVALPDFKAYMEKDLNKKGERLKQHYIGATRALGALNLTPHPDKPHIVITDVDVLVALYTQAEHLKLLNCPLLSPCYSWTMELLDGLDVYCQFHQKQLRDKEIKGEEGTHASEFSDVLTSLREVLKSGWRQRCEDHRIRALVEKKQVDLKLIKEIKVEKLQEAVLKGYIVLERIKQKYHGQASLPRKIRGLANACMAGGIAFDTFPGRKGEWEGLKFIYGSKVLEGMLDHFVCSEHKTWQVYGSIAKLLTPGLFQAFNQQLLIYVH